jgi:hypothetical protein
MKAFKVLSLLVTLFFFSLCAYLYQTREGLQRAMTRDADVAALTNELMPLGILLMLLNFLGRYF